MDGFWSAVAQILNDLGVISERLFSNPDVREVAPYVGGALLLIWVVSLAWRYFPRRREIEEVPSFRMPRLEERAEKAEPDEKRESAIPESAKPERLRPARPKSVQPRPVQPETPHPTPVHPTAVHAETPRPEAGGLRMRSERIVSRDPRQLTGAQRPRSERPGTSAIQLPPGGLDPLRPALSDTYLRLAREQLATARSKEDIEAARLNAWGALAAEPKRKACREMLDAVEEAAELRLYETMSEAEKLAWRIVRLDTNVKVSTILERSRHRVGREVELSGWEPDELRSAARTFLARSRIGELALGLGVMASGATAIGETPSTTEAEAGMEGAEPAGDTKEAGGGKVAQMPRVVPLRAVRGAESAEASGEPEEGAAVSETEIELRRLYEHRRTQDSLGEMHPRTLVTRANLAHEIGRQGRNAEAEAQFRELLPIFRSSEDFGEMHSDTLAIWHNMAVELARQGRFEAAEKEFRELLGVLAGPGAPSPEHPLTLATRHDLAATVGAQGRYQEAELVFRDIWNMRRRPDVQGEDDPQTIWAQAQMLYMRELGRPGAEAEAQETADDETEAKAEEKAGPKPASEAGEKSEAKPEAEPEAAPEPEAEVGEEAEPESKPDDEDEENLPERKST